MKKYQSMICLIAAVCLLGTAAFSVYHIYDHYAQLDEQTEVFDEIAEVVAQAPDEEPVPDDVPVSEGEDVLAKYKELYLQNEDMVGWISISGTSINYLLQKQAFYFSFLSFSRRFFISSIGLAYLLDLRFG